MEDNVIFQPLQFRNLRVKNRLFGRIFPDASTITTARERKTRINWEESFARGGVGAIISSYVPVSLARANHAELRNDRYG